MTRMGSNGPGLGAGSAPAGPRRRAARWCAAGVSVAAVVGTGLVGASAALASPTVTIPVGCSVSALNHAILFAPSNAILVLRAGCHYHPSGALNTIHRNLTIQGSNDTIAPFGTFTVLTNDAADVTINQLTIQNAFATAGGGAINNELGGHLTVTNSRFVGDDGKTGGAINNEAGSALAVTNTSFIDNAASGAGGGAIANAILATTTVNGSTFIGNDATGGSGGAIGSLGGSVTVTGPITSLFTDNSAHVDGGAIAGILGAFNVTKATFTFNHATDFGGAVANFGAPSTVATSSFTHNSAGQSGGAIATATSLDLTSDYISLNFASHHGGGIDLAGGNTSLTTTDVVGNASIMSGGGIYRSAGSLNLNFNSLVTLNHPNNCSGVSC